MNTKIILISKPSQYCLFTNKDIKKLDTSIRYHIEALKFNNINTINTHKIIRMRDIDNDGIKLQQNAKERLSQKIIKTVNYISTKKKQKDENSETVKMDLKKQANQGKINKTHHIKFQDVHIIGEKHYNKQVYNKELNYQEDMSSYRSYIQTKKIHHPHVQETNKKHRIIQDSSISHFQQRIREGNPSWTKDTPQTTTNPEATKQKQQQQPKPQQYQKQQQHQLQQSQHQEQKPQQQQEQQLQQ